MMALFNDISPLDSVDSAVASVSVEVDIRSAHPRENPYFCGHGLAEAKFLQGWHSGFFNPSCMISGASGVGKATFAYRIARYVLEGGESLDSLDSDFASDTCVQVSNNSHSNMMVLEVGLPKLPNESGKGVNTGISVEWTRKLIGRAHKTGAMAGWRVYIIDKADDMSAGAINATLKILEEPPKQSLFLLICDNPAKLPPPIRSRCQQFHLSPLDIVEVQGFLVARGICNSADEALTLAQHSKGNIGRALLWAHIKALEIYDDFVAILRASLACDNSDLGEDMVVLADKIRARDDKEKKDSVQNMGHSFKAFIDISDDYLAKMILVFAGKDGAGGVDDIIARLHESPQSLENWLDLKAIIALSAARADPPLRLSKQQTVLEILWRLRYACQGEWDSALRKFG